LIICLCLFFFSSRRRHTRFSRDWSSDVCSSDLRRRNLSFFDHFSVAVQNHVVAFLVGQIQSNREMTLLLVITLHLASLLSFCTKQCVFADHYRYCVKGAGLLIPISAVKIWCFQRDPTGKDARRNVTAKMAVLLSAHPFGSILCRRHSTIGS